MALVQIQETPRWKKLLGYVGPGILVSASYLDPGNLETDLQAGADHKHELLWIVLVGLTFAFIIQCCAARLGVTTGKHLAEHCKEEYPSPVKYCLWILAEVAVIAADIPAVLGTAFALNILFRIPMWSGVLLAGLNTLLLLGMQRYGIRKLEIVIGMLIMTMGGCCFAVMLKARPSAEEIVTGMFVPKLNGKKATTDGIALLGALVMPHNLFLHSALVISRKFPHSFNGISSATKYFFIESGLSLFLAFLINVAVISVSASVCSNPNTTSESKAHCRNITLESAAFLFKNALGKWSAKLYAISVLASGQSSTVSGTFAGQYIMQGFLDLKMELWLRNLITRCIAIGPSLVVCIVGGPHEAARLIIIVSMILAFELPFVLVPLLRFTSSETKMGQHKNPILVSLVSWLLGFCSIGINMYFLSSALIGRLTSKQMTKTESILTGVIALLIMVFYISLFTYMTLKRENSADSSHNLGTSTISTGGTGNEKGLDSSSNQRTDEIEMDDIINA